MRLEKTQGGIEYKNNYKEFLAITEKNLEKICLNLIIRKRKQEEENREDREQFFLRETKLSMALKEMSMKLMILKHF